MHKDKHRLQAACLAGGYIVRVASIEQARIAQERGAIGVLVNPDGAPEIDLFTGMLDAISVHIMSEAEHREFLVKAYKMTTAEPRPGYFIVTRAWRETDLTSEPVLPVASSPEEIRHAVACGASLVILENSGLIEHVSGILQTDQDETTTFFAQVDNMAQAVSALERGFNGLVLTFIPDKKQLPRLRQAMIVDSINTIFDPQRFHIGVIALQGDYLLQKTTLESMLRDSFGEQRNRFQVTTIRSPAALSRCDALLLPGGWSNLQSALLEATGLASEIFEETRKGKPILAICAGMVLAGSRPGRDCEDRKLLGLIDVRIDNNVLNGEKHVTLSGGRTFEALFSNGPIASELGPDVEIIARLDDGTVVAARQDNVFISAYHEGPGAHERFLDQCANSPKP
jgi:5'-phosphate synthase pdxT subunit